MLPKNPSDSGGVPPALDIKLQPLPSVRRNVPRFYRLTRPTKQAIEAKSNRSALRFSKKPTPFLDDKFQVGPHVCDHAHGVYPGSHAEMSRGHVERMFPAP